MSKRLLALTVTFVIVLSLLVTSCGKKDKGNTDSVDSSSAPSSEYVTSGTDDADDMTSSEFERLESEFIENVKPEISIIPSESDKIDSSSSVGSSSEESSSNDQTSSDVDLTESGWIDGWF